MPEHTKEDFLRKIADDPENETALLVYADWCDENGDPDRAELIRVQCELAKAYCGVCGGRGEFHPVPSPSFDTMKTCGVCDAASLRRRERQLLDANPEWSRCPCPACEGDGSGWLGSPQTFDCPVCFGVSDLFHTNDDARRAGTGMTSRPRTLSWHPGRFLRGISCTLAEAGAEEEVQIPCPACMIPGFNPRVCEACEGSGLKDARRWVPSPWALAMWAAHPTVTRFVPTDREPYIQAHADPKGVAVWFDAHPATAGSHLPPSVFAALVGGTRTNPHRVVYPTREAAVDALAVALGTLTRNSLQSR